MCVYECESRRELCVCAENLEEGMLQYVFFLSVGLN